MGPPLYASADDEEAAEGRKCEGGAVGGSGRESVHDTTCDPLVEQNRWSGGAHNSLRVPRPDPPLLHSIIFPLGHARAFINADRIKMRKIKLI